MSLNWLSLLVICIVSVSLGSKVSKNFEETHGSGSGLFNQTELSIKDQAGPGIENWHDSEHIEEWYTKLDLCILSNSSTEPLENIMKICEKEAVDRGETPLPIRCRAGNSWPSHGEYCSPEDIPFSERKNLRRAIVGYDDPKQKPLQIFFKGLAKERGSFLMVGDSVMQQFFAALACELEREGVWNDPSKFTNTDEMRYVSFPEKEGEEEEIKNAKLVEVPMKFAPIYHFVNGRWDRIANASMHHLRKNVEDLVHSHDSLTVLINMGLHYVSNPIAHFTREDYISQMTACLQYLNDIAKEFKPKGKNIRILWRETSAQHFPTSNGYWPGVKYASEMKLKCEPIQDTTPAGDWRNSDVRNIIQTNSLDNIDIIPFYNVTLPLWSSHVNGHLRDCTHFCWSPMLYQSLFHALAAPYKS
jgi:hypothetical protein